MSDSSEYSLNTLVDNAVDETPRVSSLTPKRKLETFEQIGKKSKVLELEDKKNPSSETKRQEVPYDTRSSSYKIAEMKIYRIMINKEAVVESPMLYSKLRSMAEKEIGDSKLTEHLLNHMDGTITPDINDRYQQRHNADGEMEFWIESADMVEKEAEDSLEEKMDVQPLTKSCNENTNWVSGNKLISSQEVYESLMNRKTELEKEMLQIDGGLTQLKESGNAFWTYQTGTKNASLQLHLNHNKLGFSGSPSPFPCSYRQPRYTIVFPCTTVPLSDGQVTQSEGYSSDDEPMIAYSGYSLDGEPIMSQPIYLPAAPGIQPELLGEPLSDSLLRSLRSNAQARVAKLFE